MATIGKMTFTVKTTTRKENKTIEPKRLSVPEQHCLRIARQTLKMNDAILGVMGGMTRETAQRIILDLTGKPA